MLYCFSRYISETGHRENVTICDKSNKDGNLYVSNGQTMTIALDTRQRRTLQDGEEFILSYKGIDFETICKTIGYTNCIA